MRIAPKTAARDSVTPHLGEAGSHTGIVCTSARCDHPKRRYSCSTTGKIRTRDGALEGPSGTVEMLPSVADLRRR